MSEEKHHHEEEDQPVAAMSEEKHHHEDEDQPVAAMSEEKHHHLFHHHKDEDQPVAEHDYKKEEKHLEHLGELGTAAVGGYAWHEKHKAKKDPEYAQKHKVKKGVVTAAAVGVKGFALLKHHGKKETKNEEKETHGKKLP